MIARITAVALLTCIAGQALAAGVVVGKVIAVRVDSNGRGMVFFDQPIGGTPPSCVHPAYLNALSFDATSGGKSVLAAALAAKATGETVTAYGLGACVNYNNNWVEDWNYGNFGP
jgi:hypothetical protein